MIWVQESGWKKMRWVLTNKSQALWNKSSSEMTVLPSWNSDPRLLKEHMRGEAGRTNGPGRALLDAAWRVFGRYKEGLACPALGGEGAGLVRD